jgi:hypothetical protein
MGASLLNIVNSPLIVLPQQAAPPAGWLKGMLQRSDI